MEKLRRLKRCGKCNIFTRTAASGSPICVKRCYYRKCKSKVPCGLEFCCERCNKYACSAHSITVRDSPESTQIKCACIDCDVLARLYYCESIERMNVIEQFKKQSSLQYDEDDLDEWESLHDALWTVDLGTCTKSDDSTVCEHTVCVNHDGFTSYVIGQMSGDMIAQYLECILISKEDSLMMSNHIRKLVKHFLPYAHLKKPISEFWRSWDEWAKRVENSDCPFRMNIFNQSEEARSARKWYYLNSEIMYGYASRMPPAEDDENV